jgi:hypothetical protein
VFDSFNRVQSSCQVYADASAVSTGLSLGFHHEVATRPLARIWSIGLCYFDSWRVHECCMSIRARPSRFLSRGANGISEWHRLPVRRIFDLISMWITGDSLTIRCTQRFTVNLQRCLAGYVCAWDGTNSSGPQACIDLYCPGTVDQSLIDECPNVVISSSSINWNTASATGSPDPESWPITVTQLSTSGGTSQSLAVTSTGRVVNRQTI